MKLATFRSGGSEKIGVVHAGDTRLFDLAAASDRAGRSNPAFVSMLALIDAGPAALDQARALFADRGNDEGLSVDVAAAEILAPVPEPRQMRDGMSFPLHIRQAPRGQLKLAARAKNDMAELARLEAEPLGELPEVYRKQPIYYFTNRFSVRGTNTTVKWPRYSRVMDYELEFGIITRDKGANIPASKAKDHIFGYTIFNDFSARDAQRTEMEGRLGQDFSDVRVHTDSAAHESASSVNAHAYTVGSNVVFQRGRYDTDSTEGKTMLAHELTHVVQQRSGPVDGTDAGGGIKVSDPSDRFEREAAANADAVMSTPAPAVHAHEGGGSTGSVQRDAELDELPDESLQGSFVQRDEVPEEAIDEEQGEEVAQGSFEGASVQLSAAEDVDIDSSPGCC